MTICEICGRSVHRRSRMKDGRLVCGCCSHYIRKGMDVALIEIKEQYERATTYWAELSKIKNRPTYGSAYSAIPNHWVLTQAIKALDETGNYQGFYNRLAEIYRVDTPQAYFSAEECPPEGIACYIPSKKAIVSKTKTMHRKTAFHEWFHHLEHEGYVLMDKVFENRQKNADDYAKACMMILEGR